MVEQTLVGTSVLAHLGAAGGSVRLRLKRAARAVLRGGAESPEPKLIGWNEVADCLDAVRRQQVRWAAGRFPQTAGRA